MSYLIIQCCNLNLSSSFVSGKCYLNASPRFSVLLYTSGINHSSFVVFFFNSLREEVIHFHLWFKLGIDATPFKYALARQCSVT